MVLEATPITLDPSCTAVLLLIFPFLSFAFIFSFPSCLSSSYLRSLDSRINLRIAEVLARSNVDYFVEETSELGPGLGRATTKTGSKSGLKISGKREEEFLSTVPVGHVEAGRLAFGK